MAFFSRCRCFWLVGKQLTSPMGADKSLLVCTNNFFCTGCRFYPFRLDHFTGMELNLGLLLVLAFSGNYCLVYDGWGSNNKYSLGAAKRFTVRRI
jgi:NADH:ubiquinone oxidoreductase subunit H